MADYKDRLNQEFKRSGSKARIQELPDEKNLLLNLYVNLAERLMLKLPTMTVQG